MALLFTQPLLASITKYYLKNCEKHCDNLILFFVCLCLMLLSK